jgi:glucose/arabinose dehydrogenase/mono/diheme cytochrome c family protein
MIRRYAAIFLASFLLLGSLGGAQGDDAQAEGDRSPSQYAFYPREVAQPGGDLPGDPRVELVKVAEVSEPINVVAPNDGSGRIFVLERAGAIRVVQDGEVLDEPFLDLTDNVMSAFLEQGLLGMAFHPDYAENGRFFVNYTDMLRSGDVLTVEFRVSEDDPNRADPDSHHIIMFREQPYANHIGGDIVFGPDGYLYIGHGDGGLEGDPLDAGQDLSTHLSKMLRIDVDDQGAGVGGQSYGIPEDNPFVQGDILIDLFDATEEDFARLHPKARPEIWAFGLRNPWQFSFDRETGDMWIADVGQNFWEEIDFQPADSPGGENYGWKFLQGSHCFPASEEECPKVGTLPVAEYSHEEGCSVTGGHVYRGDEFPELQGIYFHSDYCSGKIWGIAPGEDGNWEYEELLDAGLLITGSGEDEAGNIYFTSCECGYGQAEPRPAGAVWRLVSADRVPEGAEVAPKGEPAAAPAEGEETEDAEQEPEEDEQEPEEDEQRDQDRQDGAAEQRDDGVDLQAQIGQGQRIYNRSCGSCHGGQGGGGAGPVLSGNRDLGDAAATVRQIVHGGGGMPGFGGQLSDEQIAAVASFIRNSWGNDFGGVRPQEVAEQR